MATPTTVGAAALLAEKDPIASHGDIRAQIESTATQEPVGLVVNENPDDVDNGETTAPAQGISIDALLGSGANVALDGTWDGDEASHPDSVGLTESKYDSENFRGSGHINVLNAVSGF